MMIFSALTVICALTLRAYGTSNFDKLLAGGGLEAPRDPISRLTGAPTSVPRILSTSIATTVGQLRRSASTRSLRSSSPRTRPEYKGVAVEPGQKIFAIGDVHGDYEAFMATLFILGIVDEDEYWVAGNSILIQTGDIVDRGPDAKKIWDLIEFLSKDAKEAGGRVITLLGNHELMNVMGDWRYVSPEDVATFGSEKVRAYAFSKHGTIGKQIRAMKTAEKVGDTVFVHGGINARWSEVGIAGLNGKVSEILNSDRPSDHITDPPINANGPLWERLYSNFENPESVVCADLDLSLKNLRAKRMVVSHTITPQNKVHSRCDGKLVLIDIGMSRWMKTKHPKKRQPANLGGIEILDGVVTAITANGKGPPTDALLETTHEKAVVPSDD